LANKRRKLVLRPDRDSYHVRVTRWPIKHILIAAILLTTELLLGLCIIGVPAFIIAALVLISGSQRFGARLQVAAL
jgi:hypothetical protein